MLTDSTLGVIFFTRKKRNNPERLDIYVWITVNKERAEFSIKRDIAVCNWDIFRYRVKETDQNALSSLEFCRGLTRKLLKRPIRGSFSIKAAINGNPQEGQVLKFIGCDFFLC